MLLVCLIGVVIIRTLLFKPKKSTIVIQENKESFDEDKVVSNLQELIKCKTISYRDSQLEDDKEFEKFLNFIFRQQNTYYSLQFVCGSASQSVAAIFFGRYGNDPFPVSEGSPGLPVLVFLQSVRRGDLFSGRLRPTGAGRGMPRLSGAQLSPKRACRSSGR